MRRQRSGARQLPRPAALNPRRARSRECTAGFETRRATAQRGRSRDHARDDTCRTHTAPKGQPPATRRRKLRLCVCAGGDPEGLSSVEPPRDEGPKPIPNDPCPGLPENETVRRVHPLIPQRVCIGRHEGKDAEPRRTGKRPRCLTKTLMLRRLVAHHGGRARARRGPEERSGSQKGRDHMGITARLRPGSTRRHTEPSR